MLPGRPVYASEEEDNTKLWMIPYADLMSNLVILFLALFTANYTPETAKILQELGSHFERDKPAEKAEEAPKPQPIEERLKLSEFGLKVSARYYQLTLPEPVLFAPGSAELGEGAQPVLERLQALLKDIPNPVIVEGHTDDRPVGRSRWRNNWELSAARAFAVVERLAQGGVAPGRFHARGFGEYRPACEGNATRPCRALNRRIEIKLIRELRREG